MDSSLKNYLEKLEQLILEKAEETKNQIEDLKGAIWQASQDDRISYSVEEASRLTGFAYDTFYAYIRSGYIKSSQPQGKGSCIVILKDDLYDFIAKRRIDPLNPKRRQRNT